MDLYLFHALTLVLLLAAVCGGATAGSAAGDGTLEYIKLPLLRENHFPKNTKQILDSDLSRIRRRRAELPVASGSDLGTGQYFVRFRVGTPPQELSLVADTGSDLVWASCSPRATILSPRATGSSPRAAGFVTRRSSSFTPLQCYDTKCKLVPQPANVTCNLTRRRSPCRYEYSYADGSVTSGIFAHETTSFNASSGVTVAFKNFEFGCSLQTSGPSLTGPNFKGANGVMGLGRGPTSMVSQLGRRFGNKFSYCFKEITLKPTPTSYLLIGGSNAVNKMSLTPLINNPIFPTFYYIKIETVVLNGVKLPINPSVWDTDELGNGGTIIDSGTTLTFLVEPAYSTIVNEFKRLVKLPKPTNFSSPFDLCINMSSNPNPKLPELSFQLTGGSIFSPPAGNYFLETGPGIKCLALMPATEDSGGTSVIGNLMQQGFVFDFDNDRSRLGFSRHGCSL